MVCCRQVLYMSVPHYADDVVSSLFSKPLSTKKRTFLIINEDEDTFTALNVTTEPLDVEDVSELFTAGYFPLTKFHPPL